MELISTMRGIFIYLIALTYCVCISIDARAQNKYIVTQYSTEDGLPQKTVNHVQQDHSGYMWFATGNGISRFDGINFTNFRAHPTDSISLSSNHINLLREDKYGYFWILNYDNYLYRFNPTDGVFQRILSDNKRKVNTMKVLSNGDVWVHLDDGDLYRICTDNPKQLVINRIAHIEASIQSTFTNVDKDKNSNVWFLTAKELYQYNTSTRKFTCHLIGDRQQKFYCQRRYINELLLGSDNGRIYRFDTRKQCYSVVQFPTKSPIRNLKGFSKDEIIVITMNDGFFIHNLKTNAHTHYTTENLGLASNTIRMFFVDQRNDFWITYEKLSTISHVNRTQQKTSHYTLKNKNNAPFKPYKPIRILEGFDELILFHCDGNIINYYDAERNDLRPLFLSSNPEIISFNEPNQVVLDAQKNLWLTKESQGLIKVSFKKDLFSLRSPNEQDIYAAENRLSCTFEDYANNLWVTNEIGDIRLYDSSHKFKGFLTPDGKLSRTAVTMNVITSAVQDREGHIWLGTKDAGLIEVIPSITASGTSYRIVRHRHDDQNPYSVSSDIVQALYRDTNDRIWVGTFEQGLNYMEKDVQGNVRFIHAGNRLKHYPTMGNRVHCIESDKSGNLWIGTTSGVVRGDLRQTDPEKMEFLTIQRIPGNVTSLSNNDVFDIHLTRSGELYFATFGGGLCLLQSHEERQPVFRNFTKSDGLPSDVLKSILEAPNGDLWIATEDGLCHYATSTESFETYDSRFFPSDIQFTNERGVCTHDSLLMFPTDRGLLTFRPQDIRKDSTPVQLVFSQFFIKEKEVKPSDNGILRDDIDKTAAITLSHSDNSFTFHFATLDMKYPEKIQYAYTLEGFDHWTNAHTARTATYTNIPKGTYTFRVRSTNSDGQWVNNERNILITVKPSFWESAWGIALLAFIFVAVSLLTAYILLLFYKLRSKVSFEQQLNEIRTKFFTDVVHELRTPFTLIIAPLEHILSKGTEQLPDNVYQDLKLIQSNTKRTVKLINQILDFQKIQSDKMRLYVRPVEINSFVKQIAGNFRSLATEQGTDIKLNLPDRPVTLWMDSNKMENVMFNLISNAFKYSPKGREISISVSETSKEAIITVSDHGYGIPTEKQTLVFSRFENIIHNESLKQPSTGIGLAVVKEVVESHKGFIDLKSTVNEGSTFTIHLPKGKEHFDKGTEFVLDNYDSATDQQQDPAQEALQDAEEKEVDENVETILVVEDNNELRSFLQGILSEQFRVITAANGKEGLKKTRLHYPDMIVSDVMMPEMDGLTMVKQIRANTEISHTPIILLTSKSAVENEIEGLKLGIEDYITKPFSASLLKARIINVFETRKRMQALYCSQLIAPSDNEGDAYTLDEKNSDLISKEDRSLLNSVIKVINNHDPEQDSIHEEIKQATGLSGSTILRKIKFITGMTTNEFIKNVRIKRAADLLKNQNGLSVNEVSFLCGFKDQHYFSKCFKQVYGVSPKDYKDESPVETARTD